jgi:hypothetical protein
VLYLVCTIAQSILIVRFLDQNSARIKLHRYSAFLDAAIFTKKHCDLGQVSDNSSDFTIMSCCGAAQGSYPIVDDQLLSTLIQDTGNEKRFYNASSAKVCMGAALAIGRAFESLPYPNPALIGSASPSSVFGSSPWTKPPRTMPIFACCAMQSSYVLLMLCDKSRELNGNLHGKFAATNGLGELSSGLQRVLEALQNYSIAFEAVGGMRGQSSKAYLYDTCLPLQIKFKKQLSLRNKLNGNKIVLLLFSVTKISKLTRPKNQIYNMIIVPPFHTDGIIALIEALGTPEFTPVSISGPCSPRRQCIKASELRARE